MIISIREAFLGKKQLPSQQSTEKWIYAPAGYVWPEEIRSTLGVGEKDDIPVKWNCRLIENSYYPGYLLLELIKVNTTMNPHPHTDRYFLLDSNGDVKKVFWVGTELIRKNNIQEYDIMKILDYIQEVDVPASIEWKIN